MPGHACKHDDVIKWKHFPHYWPFVWGIHRPPVNSLHKSQWRRAFVFSLICAWTHGWVNNCRAGDLRRHRAHYDVTVMDKPKLRYVQSVKWIFVLIEKIWYGENFQSKTRQDKARWFGTQTRMRFYGCVWEYFIVMHCYSDRYRVNKALLPLTLHLSQGNCFLCFHFDRAICDMYKL